MYAIITIVVLVVMFLAASLRILNEYERGCNISSGKSHSH